MKSIPNSYKAIGQPHKQINQSITQNMNVSFL